LLSRRDALATFSGALCAAAAPRWAFGAAPGSLESKDLGAGLVAITGAGANVVALKATDGLLLVDGGLASKSGELLDLLAAHGGAVQMLFNTSWRDEHTGSNETLGTRGAKIAAHVNTKLWLGGDFDVDWEDRHYAPRPAAALPGMTFYTSGSLDFGGRKVEYRYLPRAHTDGDVAVFPDANVLALARFSQSGRTRFPTSTGGWIGGLEAATRALLDATDGSTKIAGLRRSLRPRRARSAVEALHGGARTRRRRVQARAQLPGVRRNQSDAGVRRRARRRACS
jgi:hypothetical protein